MGLFDHFPYTNFHELNLTWLLEKVKELENIVNNFVALNTIKYADPIQWNITTQYEANTVVVDPQSGTAYISTKAVPTGVGITNTDYWTVIFTLDVISANKNITLRDDGSNVLATFASAAGDWLLWNGTLYKVSQAINVNEAYVVGYNLDRYTVEMFITDYILQLNNIIGALDDLNTTDKSNLVAAINEVLTTLVNTSGDLTDLDTTDKSNLVAAINELVNTSGDLTDLNTTDKSNLVAAINECLSPYIMAESFGAIGDGITDDTNAINDALDSLSSGGTLILKSGSTYKVTSNILVKYSNISIIGYGATIITDSISGAPYTISVRSRNYITDEWQTSADNRLSNIKLIGVHVIGGVNESILIANCDHVIIKDCNTEQSASDSIEVRYSTHVTIDSCTMNPNAYYGLMLYQNQFILVTNCTIYGPLQGITVKGHPYGSTNVYTTIENNDILITGNQGVGIGTGVDSTEGDVMGVTITGNTITYSGSDTTDGICVRFGNYARRNIVSNNRFIRAGMLVIGDYHKINNNYFESYIISSRPAIQIADSVVHQGYIEVDSNYFMGNNVYQPWIQSSQPNTFIKNNVCEGGRGGYDIRVSGIYAAVINNISINTTNGLVQEFGSVVDSFNVIKNNISNGNVTSGIPYDFIKTRGCYINNIDISYYRDGQAPTGFKHYIGDFKPNNNPTILGSAGSQYIITGWMCTTTGTPGTWTECRAYTGT